MGLTRHDKNISIDNSGNMIVGSCSNTNYVWTGLSRGAISEHYVDFDTAPAQDKVITADYTVKGVHKTTNQVIDVSFSIQFGEGCNPWSYPLKR